MSAKKKTGKPQIPPFAKRLVLLSASIGISLLAGFIGSYFTITEISSWYTELTKPAFNPPNWIFGPVWTTLYILMGIALFMITQTKDNAFKRVSYWLFAAQLVLNTLWSIIFFGSKDLGLALFVILLLWTLIALTIYYFNKISKPAAILLIPYILWVSFATILNYSILVLN